MHKRFGNYEFQSIRKLGLFGNWAYDCYVYYCGGVIDQATAYTEAAGLEWAEAAVKKHKEALARLEEASK